ncbi:MAG TPA: tRNA lysidine(34) synthetase TilS [Propionibacteriaceae bacterium]|nr:tRNA lysidine(34) synthetase TilS [Propionibacteriaceae bacterium]
MGYRELGPAGLAVVQAVDGALSSQDTHLLVACSGGADSLALAFAARYVAIRRYLECAAMVIDHGLQDGSAEVSERVRQQLQRLGYQDVTVTSVEVDQAAAVGPEAAARQARYRALDTEARARPATVLLGHTIDDQAETVLLGLARGSGGRSLAGMAPRAGHLLRPFLHLRRVITEQACVELGLEPWQDPHNTDRRFSRVRVRQSVLPTLETELGPGVTEALARTAELLRDDTELLDRLASDAYRTAEGLGGTDTLDCAALESQPPALRRRILRLWLLAHGIGDLTLRHISAVESLVIDWHGQKSIQVPGATVTRNAGRLSVG